MNSKLKSSKALDRTKTLAATVAALGAAIGMNMQDVIAKPSSVAKKSVQSSGQPRTLSAKEIERVKKLRKGSQSLPPSLQKRPDTLAVKIGDKERLTTRPSALADKSSRSRLKNRPGVRADKSAPKLQRRPGSTSNKWREKGTDLKR